LSAIRLGGNDIVDFELDAETGEILVLEHSASGRVMRITEETNPPANYPLTLSETGVFADLSDLSPNPGVVPYTPNLKFWSDDADKSRWFVIPNLIDTIGYSLNDPWTFPEGMVWIKHFDFDLDRSPRSSLVSTYRYCPPQLYLKSPLNAKYDPSAIFRHNRYSNLPAAKDLLPSFVPD